MLGALCASLSWRSAAVTDLLLRLRGTILTLASCTALRHSAPCWDFGMGWRGWWYAPAVLVDLARVPA